ncbi:unnamed protein product [Parascedosporium putredinis]|uniref:Uncharacterized protein n=1 Tax=Parascedosporium putredinis TaxID=1442378 RepID=A0A9P1M9B0_9PEZI|nr:unnamed protein product [Parascedosporium putredinis]CAI7995354.1 unnamed protein product [Parascedosporium putredinis]
MLFRQRSPLPPLLPPFNIAPLEGVDIRDGISLEDPETEEETIVKAKRAAVPGTLVEPLGLFARLVLRELDDLEGK